MEQKAIECQVKQFQDIQDRYRGIFKKIGVKEKKILDAYSKLDSRTKNLALAEQEKDLDYQTIANRRKREYDLGYEKMLRQRDKARQDQKLLTKEAQVKQIQDREFVESTVHEQNIKLEQFLSLKDQEERLKSDLQDQEKKNRKQQLIRDELLRQQQEIEEQKEKDRYLNQNEFRLNKKILQEITHEDDMKSENQGLVLSAQRMRPRVNF